MTEPSFKILLENLSYSLKEEDLKAFLNAFGPIKQFTMQKN